MLAVDMSLSAGAKLGPYEILSLIGRGGMGEVYKVREPDEPDVGQRDVPGAVLTPMEVPYGGRPGALEQPLARPAVERCVFRGIVNADSSRR